MRASVFYSAAFAAAASAQSSSIDPYPQTNLLAQTNSLGVVTGQFSQPPVVTQQPTQPAVVTSQPAVVTTQPVPADIPAVGTGITTLVLAGTGSAFNTTRTIVVSANNSTTVQLVTSTPASGSAGASGATGSGGSRVSGSGASGASGTGAPASTGAASALQIASGSFFGFGAIVAAFL
ncbi:hypothetical protein DE146DRAFT_639743 [Phaeosphaeria sp. MPI-PUGE-AT-0046c]|nr:hypothetical protein DE146DRAFT_639743 [Phaeosphaeria sp. MPI-PUGE-AT-0046c]